MPVFVVIGPAGSGKTTVGAALAARLGWPMLDADDFHTPEAVAQIAAGVALTDADRAPWLARLADEIDERVARGEDLVLACSALRRAYREVLRRPPVEFIAIEVPAPVLAERLRKRPGHFAGPGLLASQLATYEPLDPDEPGITVDGTFTPQEIVDRIVAA